MSMRPKSAIGWGVCAGLLSIILCVGWELYKLDRRLKAEYGTIRVVQAVSKFVLDNEGRWPTSWSDLDAPLKDDSTLGSAHYRRHVVVDFSVTADQLLENPERIQTAIVPVTGEYHIYPHARRDLERLLSSIRASNHNE